MPLLDSWICKMFIIFTLFTGYLPKSIYRYVMVPTGYMPATPHLFSLNCNTQSPWQPHTPFWLSKPITAWSLGPCKWWPPWSPFASALATGWYQSHWHLSCMRMTPLYKRAGSPALCSLFGWTWPRSHLDLNLDTSCRHSPDCWFTQQLLVNFFVRLSTYTWWPACQP